MTAYSWEKKGILKATGSVVKKGIILKLKHVKDLVVSIDGKYGEKAGVFDSTKDILYFKVGEEELGTKHIPVSIIEGIKEALWHIDVDKIKSGKLNNTPLNCDDVLVDLGLRIKDGVTIKTIKMEILGYDQRADLDLSFRRNGVKGTIKFRSPVSYRNTERFTLKLEELLPLFSIKKK